MTKLVIESDELPYTSLLIKTAIVDELKTISWAIEMTIRRLKEFEQKYKKTSVEFYQQFQKGITGDSEEVMEWAGEYETLLRLQQNFSRLKEIEIGDRRLF
ncbi:MAG: hypothetical protein AB1414_01350 [bacterium]